MNEYYKKQMKLKSSKVKIGMKVKCINGEYVDKVGTCVGLGKKEIHVEVYGLKPLVGDYSKGAKIQLLPTVIIDNRLNWFEKPPLH